MMSRHSFGGHALDRHLIDLDPDEGLGDLPDGGDAAPIEAEAAAEPAPETPTAEAAPEAAAWAGPSPEEWQSTQQTLAQLTDFLAAVQDAQYQQPAAQQEEYGLPEFDPLDPEAASAYFEARDQRLLAQMQGLLSPLLQKTQEEQSEAWAQHTFQTVGVPEAEHWRRGALIASAAFQTDAYGRPVAPEHAVRTGMSFLQEFAAAERAAALEEFKKQQTAEHERLRNLTGAPSVPAGPGGVESAAHDDDDEITAWRRWKERNQQTA